MSAQVSYKKQFALGILLLLVILVSIEGFSRIFIAYSIECDFMKADTYSDLDNQYKKQMCTDHYNKIMYMIPYRHHEPNQHFNTLNINSEGFRGTEISQVKPDDSYRIFMVGGSTTFGSGSSSDNSTITGFLQQNFDNTYLNKKIEVVNAGHDGMFSWDETESIKNKIINYDPDLVIIYNGANDLQYSYNYIEKFKSEKSDFNKIEDKARGMTSFYKTLIVGNLFSKSIQKSINESKGTKPLDTENISERISLWKNKQIENCKIGYEQGFETLIILQPIIDSDKKPLTEFEKKSFKSVEDWPNYYQLFANEFEKLNGFCENTMDLRNVFEGIEEPLFYDWAHLGDKGNKIIADRIFEKILPQIQSS